MQISTNFELFQKVLLPAMRPLLLFSLCLLVTTVLAGSEEGQGGLAKARTKAKRRKVRKKQVKNEAAKSSEAPEAVVKSLKLSENSNGESADRDGRG